MPNRYWTLKHLAELGGKLSTDGKSFTLGGRTYPCTLVNSLNKARIVFNSNLMNTPKQHSEESAPTVQIVQQPTCLYVKSDMLPPSVMALLKDTMFTTIGSTRYLRLKVEARQAGLIIDQIL